MLAISGPVDAALVVVWVRPADNPEFRTVASPV